MDMVTVACSPSSWGLCGPASRKQLLLFCEYCSCVWWFSCVYIICCISFHIISVCLMSVCLSEDGMWVGASASVCTWRQEVTFRFCPSSVAHLTLWDGIPHWLGAGDSTRLAGPRDLPMAVSPGLGYGLPYLAFSHGSWAWKLGPDTHTASISPAPTSPALTAVSGCLVINPLSAHPPSFLSWLSHVSGLPCLLWFLSPPCYFFAYTNPTPMKFSISGSYTFNFTSLGSVTHACIVAWQFCCWVFVGTVIDTVSSV